MRRVRGRTRAGPYDPADMARPRPLTVGVVHTASSPCRCHASLLPALRRLGHRAFAVDADALPAGLARLAAADAVFDVTDTLRGEGWLRAQVRAELERSGATLVGPCAAAAARADDKAASRRAWEEAGVAVAPGVALEHASDRVPARLPPPFVVKAAHAHGSRGLSFQPTRRAAEAAARRILRRGDTAVVESFVAGDEVTVTLVGRPLRALPPVAVRLPSAAGAGAVLSFARKWTGFRGSGAPRGRLAVATLPSALARRVVATARAAARALDLDGFVRIDLRVTPDGRPVVLEANPRPSVEAGGDATVAADAAGWGYDTLVARLLPRAARRARRAR